MGILKNLPLGFWIEKGLFALVGFFVATIYDPSTNLESDVAPIFIGTITYENEQVFCSLPVEGLRRWKLSG